MFSCDGGVVGGGWWVERWGKGGEGGEVWVGWDGMGWDGVWCWGMMDVLLMLY